MRMGRGSVRCAHCESIERSAPRWHPASDGGRGASSHSTLSPGPIASTGAMREREADMKHTSVSRTAATGHDRCTSG